MVDYSLLEAESAGAHPLWWLSNTEPQGEITDHDGWQPGIRSIEKKPMLIKRVNITKRFLLRRFGNGVELGDNSVAEKKSLSHQRNKIEEQLPIATPHSCNMGSVRVSAEDSEESTKVGAQAGQPLIVLFGHSMMWLEFLGAAPPRNGNTWPSQFFSRFGRTFFSHDGEKPRKLKNCEMAYCELHEDLSIRSIQYIEVPKN